MDKVILDEIGLNKVGLNKVILNGPIIGIKTLVYIVLPQLKILIGIIINQHNEDTLKGALKGVFKSVLGINIKAQNMYRYYIS